MDCILYSRLSGRFFWTIRRPWCEFELIDEDGRTLGRGKVHYDRRDQGIVPISILVEDIEYAGELLRGLPGAPWQGKLRSNQIDNGYEVRLIPEGAGIAKWGKWSENSFINFEVRSLANEEWALGRLDWTLADYASKPVPVGRMEMSTGSTIVLERAASKDFFWDLFHRRIRIGRYFGEGTKFETSAIICFFCFLLYCVRSPAN